MDTSLSLLERLRTPGDQDAWNRLDSLYRPFIARILRYDSGLRQADAEDLVQEVMTVLVGKVAGFERQRTGSFRRWLREITHHCVQAYRKKQRPAADCSRLDQLADPHSDLSKLWDEEHDRHVLQKLLDLVAQDFEPATWRAFHRLVIDEAAPEQVARALGLTVGAVYLAKYRVLKRLKVEARGIVD